MPELLCCGRLLVLTRVGQTETNEDICAYEAQCPSCKRVWWLELEDNYEQRITQTYETLLGATVPTSEI